MSILEKIPYGSMVGGVFADMLTVTMPSSVGDSFIQIFKPMAYSLPAIEGGQVELPRDRGFEFFEMDANHKAKGGVFIFFSYVPAQRLFKIEAKGQFLDLLRRRGRYTEFLTLISLFPHKVTRLDVTADFSHPAHEFVNNLMASVQSGTLAFTRKLINPQKCKFMQSLNADNVLTGCVYLAQGADISAKVYDKQAERMDKAGLAIPQRTRVEISLNRGAGATLRDASLPHIAFQHFAGKFLVDCPDVEWSPMAEGFQQDPPRVSNNLERINYLADTSMDLRSLVGLLAQHNGDVDKALAHLRLLVRPMLQSALKLSTAA